MFKRLSAYILILLCALPVLIPLYSNAILGSADNLAHLFRIVNVEYALQQGYFWPRWAALEGHGYGAPIFNFNYMLPYYITIGLWYAVGTLVQGSQVYMMLVLLTSGFAMYAFAKAFFGVVGSVVCAIAYIYIPYHLMTIYLYGGYGEALAYVFVPTVLLFLYRFLQTHSTRYLILSVSLLSLLILSHNLSALMTVALMSTFIPVLWFQNRDRVQTAIRTAKIIVISALLTTWFWLPALIEEHYTKLGILFEKEAGLRDYFFQKIAPVIENSFRLLRFEAPGYYSYAIGIPSLIIFVLSIAFIGFTVKKDLLNRKQISRSTRVAIYFTLWCIVSFVMTRDISKPIWDLLPARANFLSYPYRFLFMNTFAIAGMTAFVIDIFYRYTSKKIALLLSGIIVSIFIWQGYMYAHPDIDRFLFTKEYFQSPQTVQFAPNTYKNMGYIEFIPTTADSDFVNGLDTVAESASRAIIVSGQATANVVREKIQDLYIDVNATTPSMLQINILYFPGWIGIRNSQRITPTIDSVGRMLFDLPIGTYRLHVSFQNTPIRSIALSISIISLCGLIIYTRKATAKTKMKRA